MGPSRSDRDWATLDGTVDTIDLTLSSPEPEPQPQAQPRQQQLNANYPKRESQHYSTSQVKHEHNQPGIAASNNPRALPQRQINPHHIMQIINSSDASALRKVLYDLCKMSPALSGAVARGLAPHSTFAQTTINRHRSRPPFQHTNRRIKPDPELVRPFASSSRSWPPAPVVEHQSERLTTRPSAHTSARPPVHPSSHPSANLPAAPIKKEDQASISDDSDDSSVIVDFPGSYPRSPRPNNVGRVQTRDSLSELAGPSIPQQLVRSQAESEVVPQFCIRCHQPLERDSGRCRYHTGSRVSIGGGRIVYDCCRKPFDSNGCTSGLHISEADQIQRWSMSRSQTGTPASSYSPHISKKPRIL